MCATAIWAIEMPRSPLTAVMATEVWSEMYDRLAELIHQHRTTLIFVNQRRIAERVARHLAERLGEEHVTAHHGSLAREHRLKAEQRLKSGELKALVATSSLELGIDIGDIDLVCQLGSPRAINAFVQRVGRAGHAIGAVPKGRLFPLALDDLLECAALLDAVAAWRARPHPHARATARRAGAAGHCRSGVPRMAGCRPCTNAVALPIPTAISTCRPSSNWCRRSQRVTARGEGVAAPTCTTTPCNRVLRARRGARLAAVTNAGVIPDQFDYDVVLLPEEHRVGTLNEDFAFESIPGDIFQLGNTSYRIVKVETGKVLVHDAKGQPPTMPFWLGESLGRTDELSHAVSRLCEAADAKLAASVEACERWLHEDLHLPGAAAQQLTLYLAASKTALGVLPSERRIVFERFFDEVGDTHLVIHSPYGSRINRAWGLALRKRMCRKFNFELQASALEDSIVLSLGPTHSFALDEVQHYLKAATARDILVQALLDAPMFGTRWRWNATAALAVRRMNGGRRTPPQFQRADAQDLLTVIFPDQQACAENVVGEREIPDHPLVAQTLHDCLHDTMDVDGFVRLLSRIEDGQVSITTRDLASPSPLAHAILNARPYAFLDDGAAEERRTKSVSTQPLMDLQTAHDIGRLDPQAIAQVCEEARPQIDSADELHDALLVHGFLTRSEADCPDFVATLEQQRRVTRLQVTCGREPCSSPRNACMSYWRCFPRQNLSPPIEPVSAARPASEEALREILRGRLELLGPVSAAALAAPLGMSSDTVLPALVQLEVEGAVMRGAFTAAGTAEWCDRRLLARMHRYTRDKLRAAIQPVPPAQFMRFLFRWHQVAGADGDERREGEAGLADVLRQLEGHAAPASAWEEDILALRVKDYMPAMLDQALRRRPRGVVAALRQGQRRRWPAQDRTDPRHADPAVRARRPGALAAGESRRDRRRHRAVRQGAPRARGAACARCQFLRRPAARCRFAAHRGRAGAGRTGGPRAGQLRFLRRPARAGDACRQARPAAAPAAGARAHRRCRPMVVDARAAPAIRCPRCTGRAARGAHRARAAAPLRCGVPQVAGTRGRSSTLARPVLRAAPPGSPWRGAWRPLRQRLLRRAVRAAASRLCSAQDREGAGRGTRLHLGRRSSQSRRHSHA